jgi:hypothetical protein
MGFMGPYPMGIFIIKTIIGILGPIGKLGSKA